MGLQTRTGQAHFVGGRLPRTTISQGIALFTDFLVQAVLLQSANQLLRLPATLSKYETSVGIHLSKFVLVIAHLARFLLVLAALFLPR
jgi:hypothetical protein